MKQTRYAPKRHLNTTALDLAYVRYHGGAIQRGSARDAMVAAGVSHTEAVELLAAPTIPSKRYTPRGQS